MRRLAPLAALAALSLLSACVGDPGTEPRSARLPSTGRTLALRPISNKSQQFGLEDALFVAVRDEFLRDGRYRLTPEKEADDVVAITITRYLLEPVAYDEALTPISYRLSVLADVRVLDRATDRELWKEKDLEGSITYPNQVLAGGQTEDQARATIWTILAPMIVSRAADGLDKSLAGVK